MKLNRTVALAVTLLASALVTAPAQASTTYTPNGGPNVSFVGNNVSFTAVQANQTLTCTTFDLAGSVINPGTSRAHGANAGTMSTLTSSGCTNPTAGATTVTPTSTWALAITGDESGSTSPAQLKNVAATVSSAGCTFNVGGAVNGTFNNSTQVFTPTNSTPSPLKITSVPSGSICPVLGVAQGQDITVGGSWTNTPPPGSSPLIIGPPPTTYTPSGGPSFNLVGSGVAFTVVQANQSITCTQFDSAGSVTNPGSSRPFGAAALSIPSSSVSGCGNPWMGSIAVDPSGRWTISITGAESGATSSARLNSVAATVTAVACTFDIGGAVNGTFNDATQTFTPINSSPSPLKITSNPVGVLCPIMGWANGQDITVQGSWTNVPPAGSSPLTIANP